LSEITFHEYQKKDVTNAMVIISFPTIGLVSTIVANFLVTKLKLKRIGALLHDDFYPAAIIKDGIPTPPVGIFAGDNECGPDGSCDQLVIISSDLPIKASLISPLADKILGWCRQNRCKLVTTIEGVNRTDPLGEEIGVFHVASNDEALRSLEGLPTQPLERGMVSGLSGVLLYKGNISDFGVTCLLAEAHQDYPDSRSAAEVLKVLDKMVPQIKMDPKPLLEEAKYIEDQIKKGMSQIKPMPPAELPDIPPGMYR